MIALRHIRSGHGHDLVVTRLEMLVPALVDYFETNGIDAGFTAAIRTVSASVADRQH